MGLRYHKNRILTPDFGYCKCNANRTLLYKRVQQFVKSRLQNWGFDVDANRETLAAQWLGRRGFETYHHRQLVASVISLATSFLCSASKTHRALILLLLASEPDSLRWIPVRIRDENIQIVHALQSQLTDFDKKSISFYFQLAAELHRAGIFDIIQQIGRAHV